MCLIVHVTMTIPVHILLASIVQLQVLDPIPNIPVRSNNASVGSTLYGRLGYSHFFFFQFHAGQKKKNLFAPIIPCSGFIICQ